MFLKLGPYFKIIKLLEEKDYGFNYKEENKNHLKIK
jgi:hypothetical protein